MPAGLLVELTRRASPVVNGDGSATDDLCAVIALNMCASKEGPAADDGHRSLASRVALGWGPPAGMPSPAAPQDVAGPSPLAAGGSVPADAYVLKSAEPAVPQGVTAGKSAEDGEATVCPGADELLDRDTA